MSDDEDFGKTNEMRSSKSLKDAANTILNNTKQSEVKQGKTFVSYANPTRKTVLGLRPEGQMTQMSQMRSSGYSKGPVAPRDDLLDYANEDENTKTQSKKEMFNIFNSEHDHILNCEDSFILSKQFKEAYLYLNRANFSCNQFDLK